MFRVSKGFSRAILQLSGNRRSVGTLAVVEYSGRGFLDVKQKAPLISGLERLQRLSQFDQGSSRQGLLVELKSAVKPGKFSGLSTARAACKLYRRDYSSSSASLNVENELQAAQDPGKSEKAEWGAPI